MRSYRDFLLETEPRIPRGNGGCSKRQQSSAGTAEVEVVVVMVVRKIIDVVCKRR